MTYTVHYFETYSLLFLGFVLTIAVTYLVSLFAENDRDRKDS